MDYLEILNMVREAAEAAEAAIKESCSAADLRKAKIGLCTMEDCLYKSLRDNMGQKTAEATVKKRAGIDLGGLKDNVQYGVVELAKTLGVSVETVRRWSNDPLHPLKPHLRRTGSHRKFYIGGEVVRAMNARVL